MFGEEHSLCELACIRAGDQMADQLGFAVCETAGAGEDLQASAGTLRSMVTAMSLSSLGSPMRAALSATHMSSDK